MYEPVLVWLIHVITLSFKKENKELRSQIIGKFYNIGQPLNDNVLQMNSKQMKWCFGVVELAEQLNGL